MDVRKFESELRADVYTEIEEKTLAARPANGEHGHHFSIRGLVLSGTFIVTQDNETVVHRTGDVFSVPEGKLHYEEVGPEGARIILGRKF